MNYIKKSTINLLFTASLAGLVGCQNIPYHPEPFGSYDYDDKGGVKNREVSFLTRGVVTARPNPIINISTISEYAAVQDAYLKQFALMSADTWQAGKLSLAKDTDFEATIPIFVGTNHKSYFEKDIASQPAETAQFAVVSWAETTLNGLNYVDAVCADYLRQLDRLKRNAKGASSLTSNIKSTADAILSLTIKNTTRPLGLVAAAFGLAGNAFDVYEETILTKLDFSSLHQMVKRMQYQYKSHLAANENKIDTRSEAVNAIQSYLMICTPAAIEANINNAVQGKSVGQFLVNAGLLPVSGELTSGLDVPAKPKPATKTSKNEPTVTSKINQKRDKTSSEVNTGASD